MNEHETDLPPPVSTHRPEADAQSAPVAVPVPRAPIAERSPGLARVLARLERADKRAAAERADKKRQAR